MTEEIHANRFRRVVRLRRVRSQASEEAGSQEPSSSEEAHEQESAASDASDKAAQVPKKRKTSRKIRRYEVPIDTGDGSTQTVLRFKPLGFWKMFAAVMLGFFTGLLLFLAATVLAVIILGGILWGVVKDRVGDWVVDVANQVSEELDEAEESVGNIADRVDQTVENIGEQAVSTASSLGAQATEDSG